MAKTPRHFLKLAKASELASIHVDTARKLSREGRFPRIATVGDQISVVDADEFAQWQASILPPTTKPVRKVRKAKVAS